ncbi:uncharacterized protein Z518_01117 [Rhinocladiella mackenziei CBS 650.93]|uniref:Uncharacterized protein n=1 Tax=Rhinocladiella mackenziei CBS 650.93 TaxID=1442369 RepID=A0A0D2J318_9EURO|nr:uncharacterized protein Z518_01117 [Rhinocladiella mackenziei CBS 650.93]KIX10036.1 hypothetical protein Z518_01117 [Rhinocladiella mackenziei CBS 650.93]
MASEKPPSITLPPPIHSGRRVSPSPHGLRQRPLGRSSTFAEGHAQLNRRRGSFLSETLSETRKSLRSSTDDILLPRAKEGDDLQVHDDTSHWQSLPLGLALLPAVGGLLFKNGSAVITDVTLLGLAAIFMNWALRSPWDWYRAAQTPIFAEPPSPTVFSPIDKAAEQQDPTSPREDGEGLAESGPSSKPDASSDALNAESASAERELRIYELMALFSCFAFPLLAAWLLHGIRSQLTRPSEGLVSNYNLTIFILVAEIRPLSHLIKLVQRRTLFLQRRVNADALIESRRAENQQLRDVTHRLEELEAHVAERIDRSSGKENESVGDELAAKASALASSDIKKSVQPELDALNRAMRRYEKRTTISAVQIEARLQDLESRLDDVVSLAAAAQRTADRKPGNYVFILTNWICAGIVLPVQYLMYLSSLPGRILSAAIAVPRRYVRKRSKSQPGKESRASRRGPSTRSGERERRPKPPS